MIADTKKVQSFIQYFIHGIIDKLEESQMNGETVKTKWDAHNPDLTKSNLTTQQITDANALINGLNILLIDHAAIITTLKDKNVPSHGIKSLD